MESHIVRTEEGQLLWFDAQKNAYEVVEEVTEIVSGDNISAGPTRVARTPLIKDTSNTTTTTTTTTTSEVHRNNYWTNTETLLLMSLCKEYKEKLNNPKNQKKIIFKEISIKMSEKNHFFSWEQCQGRLKTLMTKYKEVRDYNNTSVHDHKMWEYFEIMEDYMGNRPFVKPVASCSSLKLAQLTTANCENNGPIASDSSAPSERNESIQPRKKRRVSSNPRGAMLKWLEEYSRKESEQEQHKIELAKKHHEENLEVMKSLVEVLKNKNN